MLLWWGSDKGHQDDCQALAVMIGGAAMPLTETGHAEARGQQCAPGAAASGSGHSGGLCS